MSHPPVNEFWDENHLPDAPGILLLPVSQSKIDNQQRPETCLETIKHFDPKVTLPEVGINFVYTEHLYLKAAEDAQDASVKFLNQSMNHKQGVKNLISKEAEYVPKAVSFHTWNQLLLNTPDFPRLIGELHSAFENSDKLRSLVHEDLSRLDKEPSEEHINFILEEILAIYLVSRGRATLPNDLVEHEEWVLPCYPGKPLKSEVHVFQENMFDMSWPDNPYENSYYDSADNTLYDYDRVDLDTLQFD